MLLLSSKRALLRNQAPYDEHFVCTEYKAPYAIWLNIDKLKEIPVDKRYKVIIDAFDQLGLNE